MGFYFPCTCGNYMKRGTRAYPSSGCIVEVCGNCGCHKPQLKMTPETEEVIRGSWHKPISSGSPMPKCKSPKGFIPEDKGKHYRYSYRTKVTQGDVDRGYKDINLDPYRICEIYNVGGGYIEHIAKKALRGGEKGHSREDLLKEIICCAERGLEMLKEDK